MKEALKKALESKKDLLVTDDISGNVIAVIKEENIDGESKFDRLIGALQDEFSANSFEIKEVEDSKNDGIRFEFHDIENDGKHFIQLIKAWIY